MKQYKRRLLSALAVAFTFLGLSVSFQSEARAQRRVNDRQVEQIIKSIERRSDTFRRSFDAALDRSRLGRWRTAESHYGIAGIPRSASRSCSPPGPDVD